MRKPPTDKYPYMFVMLYALIYMCHAIYNTFFPVYLDHAGFGRTAIGSLMALGPFIAMVAQPVWGMAGDRAKTKNDVLKIMVLGCGIAILFFPIADSYYYLFIMIAVFTFFQTGSLPLSDAITLEYLEKSRWKFGPIRMAGTISFSLMAVGTGIFLKDKIGAIFPLYTAICVVLFIAVCFLPKVKGHRSKESDVSVRELFKNRELVLLMAFNFSIQIALAYYYSFFPIYFRSLGGDNSLLGWTQFVAAMSEIPFLLFADRIVGRFGTKRTMLISAFIFSIRWVLFSAVTDVYAVLFINTLHGFGFIVLQYCMALYINKNVPRELKVTGQTMNGLIGLGASRIIGSVLGGYLSDICGMRQTFLYNAAFTFVVMVVFICIFFKTGFGETNRAEIEA